MKTSIFDSFANRLKGALKKARSAVAARDAAKGTQMPQNMDMPQSESSVGDVPADCRKAKRSG